MKHVKKLLGAVLVVCIFVLSVSVKYASAENLYKYYKYHKKDKMYNVQKMYKGKELTYKKDYYNYQVVKMTKNRITLRRQVKWVDSDDPVFGGKSKTYNLSSKCKFYYRDVIFPYNTKKGIAYYKRISKSVVQKSLNTGNEWDRFFGVVYMDKGKVIAIACDGGDWYNLFWVLH